MNRRDKVLNLLNENQPQTYIPAAFFLHFDSSCHRGQAAIEKHQEFFRSTGMDFVKIQYEQKFPTHPIESPSDWATVPRLNKEYFEPQLEVVRGLTETMKAKALVIVTLYSPFMCAGQVGGGKTLTDHLKGDPEAVKKGLEIITDSLMEFVRECIHIGVDGFYHSTQGYESRRFPDTSTFTDYIKPFDLLVMEEINQKCPFNILHICDYHKAEYGGYDDLVPFLDYPGDVVNCSLQVGDRVLSSAELAQTFNKPFMGGMDRMGSLARGTDEEIREETRRVLETAPERFILGADCTVPGATPWGNLRVAIEEAHRFYEE